jgi:predicted CoA-binding protein
VQEAFMPTTRADIDSFLGHHRIAMVGVSRDPKHFSRYVLKELSTRGYDVVAVNPSASEVEGRPCFANVKTIEPPVEAALVMTPPSETIKVVDDCADAGIHEVWMHRGGGQGSVSQVAVALCREKGIRVVEGECPLMFLPNTQFPHRVHGFIKKLVGSFPRA